MCFTVDQVREEHSRQQERVGLRGPGPEENFREDAKTVLLDAHASCNISTKQSSQHCWL